MQITILNSSNSHLRFMKMLWEDREAARYSSNAKAERAIQIFLLQEAFTAAGQ